MGSEIGDWIDTVGGKKRGRVYGLGSQARDAVRGESSSRTSSNSEQVWQQEVENRVTSLNAEWRSCFDQYLNQCNMMFNSIFDHLQIRPPFPFPPPRFPFPCPTGPTQPPHPSHQPPIPPVHGPTHQQDEDNDDEDEDEDDDE